MTIKSGGFFEKCGGDHHPTLPAKICLRYAWREFDISRATIRVASLF